MITLLILFCLIVNTTAWLPPERCAKGQFRARRSDPETMQTGLTSNIDQVVADQQKLLKEEYGNYEFLATTVYNLQVNSDASVATVYAPHNCTFYTHKPRILAPFTCHSTPNCRLSHTVSTVESYTALEGYNWGAKVSSKFTVVEKVFEIGGEVSTGGTYSCSYTKGRTTTTTVECSTNKPGRLLLYIVNSDLKCNLGKITLTPDSRGQDGAQVSNVLLDTTSADREAIYVNSIASYNIDGPYDYGFLRYGWLMIDPDSMPRNVFDKIKQQAPHFNPYTDLINFDFDFDIRIRVYYFKRTGGARDKDVIIPLTNAYGDAVYEYVCQFTPS